MDKLQLPNGQDLGAVRSQLGRAAPAWGGNVESVDCVRGVFGDGDVLFDKHSTASVV